MGKQRVCFFNIKTNMEQYEKNKIYILLLFVEYCVYFIIFSIGFDKTFKNKVLFLFHFKRQTVK